MAYDEEYEDEGSELEQLIESEEQELEEMQQMNAEQQRQKQIEEKLLKNKLNLICRNISGGRTSLNLTEKTTMKKAKAFPNLKNNIQRVNLLLSANKAKMTMKAISSAPALFYVFIGILILFLIICAVAYIGSIMPWLFPDDNTNGGKVSSAFGIKGKDFYGARMVYIDDEKANIEIIEDYVELVESGIKEAKTITSIATSSGNVNITLEVDISLPAEDYDYSTFNEDEFKTNYSMLYTTVFDIAKIVYKIDNSVDYSGLNLVECINGILYFGYGQTAMADITKKIQDVVVLNSVISAEGGVAVNKETDVKPLIESKLTALYTNPKYNIRAEKLFVKDYILTKDDKMMEDISKENYVAFIFMPKTNVTFNKFSFSVGNADLTNFTISLKNNGSEIILTKDDTNYSVDENATQSYIYISENDLSESAGVFEDINVSNLNSLSEGLSLFDIVENVDNYSTYLESATSENSVEYLTIKKNGVVVNLSNTEAFNFVEFETTWQTSP